MSSKAFDSSVLTKVPNLVSEDPSIVTPTNSRFPDGTWESFSRLASEESAKSVETAGQPKQVATETVNGVATEDGATESIK
ncbi:hypothetical protein BC937DRAFT_89480 [Endogone sp. FLAS-F59071]|nr:hypothetical protein BC937DRAFT_89480 [Endogone sp. FLAS-F59071]|eukprot:RUS17798.1 hypothetical protein BC937DRAFT_89480 [Endogone sp. FLAS-F59071]